MLTQLSHAALDWFDQYIPADVQARIDLLSKECNEYGYDDWGFHLGWFKRMMTFSSWLYRHYFRVETEGLDHIPEGRVMLIGNHSSQMAYDGLLIITALFLEANPPRSLKAMIEYFFATKPLYSELMPRIGQVTGSPENCIKMLESDQAVLVFPEGGKGGGKVIFDRYKLMPFGTGFMKLAMQTKTPIVPFGFIGGEEMVPSLSRMMPLAKAFGVPYLPLSPTLIFPLPTKCSLYFGKPMIFNEDLADQKTLKKNVKAVEAQVRQLMDKGLQKRKSIF